MAPEIADEGYIQPLEMTVNSTVKIFLVVQVQKGNLRAGGKADGG